FGAFLTHLATEWQVSVSTKNQAKSALLVYRQMLGSIELARLGELVHSWMNKRLSMVLTRDEVRAVAGPDDERLCPDAAIYAHASSNWCMNDRRADHCPVARLQSAFAPILIPS
ncbi:MAG: hypothetical protein WA914_03715, partial [Candidatus Macondimonas sp.]